MWELDLKDFKKLNIIVFCEGDVKGIYIVEYYFKIDILSIKYEVYSCDGFVLGVILVVEWFIGKKGVYNMKDVFNLK